MVGAIIYCATHNHHTGGALVVFALVTSMASIVAALVR
jgi:hypothetical protein